MNERIRELLEQATECYSNGQERTFDKEKFAELIVEECVKIADHSNVTGKSIIGERIKQHFGVVE